MALERRVCRSIPLRRLSVSCSCHRESCRALIEPIGGQLGATSDLEPGADLDGEHPIARVQLREAMLEYPLRFLGSAQNRYRPAISPGPIDLPPDRSEGRCDINYPPGVHSHQRGMQTPLRLCIGDHRLAECPELSGPNGVTSSDRRIQPQA